MIFKGIKKECRCCCIYFPIYSPQRIGAWNLAARIVSDNGIIKYLHIFALINPALNNVLFYNCYGNGLTHIKYMVCPFENNRIYLWCSIFDISNFNTIKSYNALKSFKKLFQKPLKQMINYCIVLLAGETGSIF